MTCADTEPSYMYASLPGSREYHYYCCWFRTIGKNVHKSDYIRGSGDFGWLVPACPGGLRETQRTIEISRTYMDPKITLDNQRRTSFCSMLVTPLIGAIANLHAGAHSQASH